MQKRQRGNPPERRAAKGQWAGRAGRRASKAGAGYRSHAGPRWKVARVQEPTCREEGLARKIAIFHEEMSAESQQKSNNCCIEAITFIVMPEPHGGATDSYNACNVCSSACVPHPVQRCAHVQLHAARVPSACMEGFQMLHLDYFHGAAKNGFFVNHFRITMCKQSCAVRSLQRSFAWIATTFDSKKGPMPRPCEQMYCTHKNIRHCLCCGELTRQHSKKLAVGK